MAPRCGRCPLYLPTLWDHLPKHTVSETRCPWQQGAEAPASPPDTGPDSAGGLAPADSAVWGGDGPTAVPGPCGLAGAACPQGRTPIVIFNVLLQMGFYRLSHERTDRTETGPRALRRAWPSLVSRATSLQTSPHVLGGRAPSAAGARAPAPPLPHPPPRLQRCAELTQHPRGAGAGPGAWGPPLHTAA